MQRLVLLLALVLSFSAAAEEPAREFFVSGFGGYTHRAQPPFDTVGYGASFGARLTQSWGATMVTGVWKPWADGTARNPLAPPATLPTTAWEAVVAAGPTFFVPALDGKLLFHVSPLAGFGMVENDTNDISSNDSSCGDCTARGSFGFAIGGRAGLDFRPVRWLSFGPEVQAYKIFYVSTTALLIGGSLKIWL